MVRLKLAVLAKVLKLVSLAPAMGLVSHLSSQPGDDPHAQKKKDRVRLTLVPEDPRDLGEASSLHTTQSGRPEDGSQSL